MKRHSLKFALVALAAFAPGCGDVTMLFSDGGTKDMAVAGDMAMNTADMMWYQLKAGIYTVTAALSLAL